MFEGVTRPADVARALDFAPPADYVFAPELVGPTPRPIPRTLDDGPYVREGRKGITRLLSSGVLLSVVRFLPGVDTLAGYLSFLQYIHWFGLALLVVGVVSFAHLALRRGPFDYVRHGQPLVARVTDVGLRTESITDDNYRIGLIYRHPHTGALTRTVVTSKTTRPMGTQAFALPFDVGDYVTAVYLSGRSVERSLRVYALLDISPTCNIGTTCRR